MKPILILLAFQWTLVAFAKPITVGSKNFTESYILAELVAQTLEDQTREPVKRLYGMGGTGLIFESLKKGEIDMYIEYTGTLTEAILKTPRLQSTEALKRALEPLNLKISESLGFNNTYALAVRKDFARKYGLEKISDLRDKAQQFRAAFSYEFMSRADGFSALKRHYKLSFGQVQRMDHALVYEAIDNNQVDVVEVYSTDAKINKMDLVVLEDDKHFFPAYEAVILASKRFTEAHPDLWKALSSLRGTLNEEVMRKLNADVDIHKKSFAEAISIYMKKEPGPSSRPLFSKIWNRTKEHLFLVVVSLVFSIVLGVPLGMLAFVSQRFGHLVLLVSSLLQTIPSLALLCFLIPFFGVGALPALIALVLYGLLPVVVNTYEGLRNLDPKLIESSLSLSLSAVQRMLLIRLPLASPNILVGIKTSAIISIGTATLAAFIGAGGYGAPIITGLALNDMSTILTGAIPAAVMAILAHFLFEILRVLFVPKGLRL